MHLRRIISALVAALCAASVSHAAEAIDFNRQIKPIFEQSCVKCHSGEKPKGRLDMQTRASALKGGDSGPGIVAGQPEKSPIYTLTALPPDNENVMPPSKEPPLTKGQIETIKNWIAQGAPWPEDVKLTGVRRVDFVKDIQPILEGECVRCHHEREPKGQFSLTKKETAFKGGNSGPGVIPKKPLQSLLYVTVALDPKNEMAMPPSDKGGPLTNGAIKLIATWIEQGAVWPDGVDLVARKKESALAGATGDDMPNVVEIHKMITSKLDVKSAAEMKAYTNTIPGTQVTFAMVPIAGGEFTMGSADGSPDEAPPHKVKVAPFWMGTTEVTWNEYELFMYSDEERKFRNEIKTDPAIDKISDGVARPTKPYVEMSFGMGKDGYPAISMTQHAANKYCEWLSAKTGQYYRLPTEAEWEYACRAGTATKYSFGDDEAKLGEFAWFEANSDFKYQKVGRKKPNPWGLFDMHGNVAEWCIDGYEPDYKKFANGVAEDPWVVGTTPYPHVVRGGSWNDTPEKLRTAARLHSDKSWKQQDPQLPKSIWYLTDAQFLGFRVVRPLTVPDPEKLHKVWNNGVAVE
jgi:formylglycine-generating enzyme required for sulfatase activity